MPREDPYLWKNGYTVCIILHHSWCLVKLLWTKVALDKSCFRQDNDTHTHTHTHTHTDRERERERERHTHTHRESRVDPQERPCVEIGAYNVGRHSSKW